MIRQIQNTVRLGNHCSKIGSGSTPRGGDSVYKESGVSFIRSQNVYNGSFNSEGLVYLSEEHADQLKGVTVKNGDVLLNITGDSVARSCLVPEDILPARVSQHVAIIRPHPKDFDSRFVGFFLVSPFMQETMLSLAGSGGTRKALTKEMIENFEVPKPSRAVQEGVADILSAYNDLIENNRRRIKLLEESARLLYQEWFVRYRFPRHEQVLIIRGIPDRWKLGSLSDFYDTASGGTPSRTNPDFFTGEVLWVKTQELLNEFVTDTEEKITEDALKKSAAKLFPERTVLVAMYGATIGQLGITTKPAASNQACCAIIPRDSRASFIHAFLFLRENKEKLVDLSMGAAQKNINQQIIRGYPMLMPPEQLMTLFNDTLKPIFDQLLNLQCQNERLKDARELLLPSLMSGEITV